METVASALEEDPRFELLPHGYVQESNGHPCMSANVLALYDQLELDGVHGPLLTTFAGQQEQRSEPCLPENARFADRLGHSSDTYALAPAQRDAFAHLTVSQDGEVLAVNGPPGTGKTTMLLSVIATLCASRFQDGDFLPDYLYGQIDLLIVDEAGQVTPEIAGASFALAKRALIIGDTAQIEPIWSVPSRIEVGNLRQVGLIGADDNGADVAAFLETGRAASSGSVMRIAQHTSRYHQDQDLERGLMLYEHRRCFDEIIGYCNDLCYRGKLQPKRGPKSEARSNDGLPAMGYLHIDGRCDAIPGGSRRNALEAETIARWLAERHTQLLASYPGKRLAEIVGIVTPFAGQARAITSALGRQETLAGADLTIGTINTFQGGQRLVILFSPTYSKHADGNFIDGKASMLNVAVSRAMNSFLVFGDMDCFSSAAPGSPRGRLRHRLLAHDGNRLFFDEPARPDLSRQAGLVHLTDLDAHDGFLRDVLEECRRDIHIVTPWLTDRGLQGARIVLLIEAAANSGVAVTVYTDRTLNEWRGKQDKSALASFANAKQCLEGAGATVIEVKDVHSKIVMADNNVYCVGSFNWLSAAREGSFVRHETSLAYRGSSVSSEIETMKDSLRKRAIV